MPSSGFAPQAPIYPSGYGSGSGGGAGFGASDDSEGDDEPPSCAGFVALPVLSVLAVAILSAVIVWAFKIASVRQVEGEAKSRGMPYVLIEHVTVRNQPPNPEDLWVWSNFGLGDVWGGPHSSTVFGLG